MIEDIDYRLILGSTRHKDFGAVILFGMGGAATELIGDFSIALPPLNQTLARRLIEETKAYKLIRGWGESRPTSGNWKGYSSISPILSPISPK